MARSFESPLGSASNRIAALLMCANISFACYMASSMEQVEPGNQRTAEVSQAGNTTAVLGNSALNLYSDEPIHLFSSNGHIAETNGIEDDLAFVTASSSDVISSADARR